MGLFKKKYDFPNDAIIVNIVLAKEFEPKNNQLVSDVIDNIDDSELQGLPSIQKTYPNLNFQQVQVFFSALKKVFVGNSNQDVHFDKLTFLQKETKGKKTIWNDYLVIENFTIDMDFTNITIPVVYAIFTSEMFDSVGYEDKVDAANDFIDEYEKQTGTPKNQLANIPTEADVDNNNLEFIDPIKKEEHDERIAQQKRDQEKQRQKLIKQQKQQREQQDRLNNQRKAAAKSADSNNSEVTASRSRQRSARNANAQNENIYVMNSGTVEAPQFEIKKFPESYANPANDHYIEYMINERKKESNTFLRNYASKLNLATNKKLNKKAEEYRNELDQKIKSYQQDNLNKSVIDSIRDEIKQRLNTEKQVELQREINVIEANKKKQINEASKRFEDEKDKINANAQTVKASLETKLSSKYAQSANEESDKKVNELHQSVENKINEIIKTSVRTDNNNLNGNALSEQENNLSILNKIFEKISDGFAEYTNALEQQHSNAMRAKADADNAKYKLTDAENSKNQLIDYKERYESNNAKLLSEQERNRQLMEKINKLETLINSKNGDSSVDKLAELIAAQELAQNQKLNSQTTKSVEEKNHRVLPWILSMFFVLVIGGAGTIGGITYHNKETATNEKIMQLENDSKKTNNQIEQNNKEHDHEIKKRDSENKDLKNKVKEQSDNNNRLQDALINLQNSKNQNDQNDLEQ